jgi:DnaK suppressor protein
MPRRITMRPRAGRSAEPIVCADVNRGLIEVSPSLVKARGAVKPPSDISGGFLSGCCFDKVDLQMDTDRARELLAAERERIERALVRREHADTGEEADDQDPGNLASELYQEELDEGVADDLREELAAVERAEARLAAGTYGLSIESGKPIPDERLEAVPTAERTVEEEGR